MLEKIRTAADDKILKQSFLYTFIIGIVAHGYCFLNLMVSHDSLNDFYVSDRWERAAFGRIFYSIYISLTRGRIVLPWLIGILALCWISVAVYLIVKTFEIKRSGMILMVSGICVTNPTVYALAATYIHDLDADMLAMLLSVVAVYLWCKAVHKNDVKYTTLWLFAGSICLSVSMGIYQSYIALSVTLIIFYSLKELLDNRELKNVLAKGCYAVGMLLASAALYVAELKLFEGLTGVAAMNSATYNGIGNVTAVFSGNVFENVCNTYISLLDVFKDFILTSYPQIVSIGFLGIVACLGVAFTLAGLKNMKWKSRVLFLVLFMLLPFAMNITYFLSSGTAHILTQYAVWMLYLLVIIFEVWFESGNTSKRIKKAAYLILACSLLFVITENIQTSNTVYVKKELEYQATLSYMTRVAERMEEQEGYVPGETSVLIIGENVIGNSKTGFERYEVITGVGENGAITYHDTYKDYFKYVLARPISLSYDDKLKNSEKVSEMPVFPKQGSVQMVDQVLVVKLSGN